MHTHYDNLHVSEKASPEVIRAAYKALAQKWHPDKNADQREKAENYFKIITKAFDVLSSAETRAEYDAWLEVQRQPEPLPEEESQPFPQFDKYDQQRKTAEARDTDRKTTDQARMAEAREDGKRSLFVKEKAAKYALVVCIVILCIWAIGRYDLGEGISGLNKSSTATSMQVQKTDSVVLQQTLKNEEEHFRKIYAVHPDADDFVKSQDFERWIAGHVSRERRAREGTADDVIQLFSEYKAQKTP